MKNKILLSVIAFLSLSLSSVAQNEIIVAKDGSGNFMSIQDAINCIPTTNAEWKTIIVKNGVYDEHVMIKSSFVALVGESRAGTHIENNLPRAVWYAANGTNTGAGVVNVATNMHDIVIANLYIRNTFEGSEDYTEVIRTETGTTKIWVINCDVLCLWKDTFAPWGKAGGMYYVSDCAFRGSIDAFCPRGYCYANNCQFTETKSSSPIWHEGVGGTEDQKLIVQGGSVHSEYNKQVKLQNSQNYAKFYYLDVQLSDSIGSLGVSATTYFYGVKGLAGTTWFADNLTLANRKQIDAVWTFDGKWDPESTMPSVLPFAALPQPYNGRYSVASGITTLKWIPMRKAISHKIYFGTTEQPSLLVETTSDFINTPILEAHKTYYWRVDTSTNNNVIQGQLWRFTTSDNIDPVTSSTLTLIGKNNQTVIIGNQIETISYKMGGATQYKTTCLPIGTQTVLKHDTISISGTPTTTGTYGFTIETTDALSNGKATGTIVVKNINDTIPDSPTETDYTSTRLTRFSTILDCKIMSQEPTWITKTGSVSWSTGIGYKWGSTSAALTVKVNGCSRIECTFLNNSTSHPIIISDGGSLNDKTAYLTAANVEATTTFIPKTTASDDITIKTSGSSGMSLMKIILFGNSTAIQQILSDKLNVKIESGLITSIIPFDIYTVSGQLICSKRHSIYMHKGIYILSIGNIKTKIIIS
jgi:pectinesterase